MMMRNIGVQQSLFTVTLEDIVPADHFLRKLDELINFDFVYEELSPYYCTNNGRPSIDPVIIVKSLLIGFLYGIESERRLEQELKYNVAYRWFLGLSFNEPVPDHSTVSQLRKRKFNDADLFKKLFTHIVYLCAEAGLISGKLLVTDSTHVKANASKTSKMSIEIDRQTEIYFEKLDALDKYEAEERERLNMSEINRKPPSSTISKQTMSTTDEDAGWLMRPNKPNGFHYLAHQTIDCEHGIIVDVSATRGNVSDNTMYIGSIDAAIEILNELNIDIETISADSSYDTAIIHKELNDRGIVPFMPKKQLGGNSKAEFKQNDFKYNQDSDEFICPNGNILALRTTERNESGVFRKYLSNRKDCKSCQYRDKCLAPSQTSRKIRRNIFQEIVDEHHSKDGSSEYIDALNKRQIWCEGTFAVQKSQHNLKQILRRGLSAAKDHFYLVATAINLKRMVKYLV